MKRQLAVASIIFLAHCTSSSPRRDSSDAGDLAASHADAGTIKPDGQKDGGGSASGTDASQRAELDAQVTPVPADAQLPYPDAHDPNDSPPVVGGPGCGLSPAAFCDSFGGAATVRGRAGEMDSVFWSAGRMFGQFSATRAMGIGAAVIPSCRPGVADKVWPQDDALICDPVDDVKSHHLLLATAAQNYGQNGFRVRQPFDFAGRTGRIVFDASTDPLGTLFGWVSLAITEDPIATPGYAMVGNDEGSIIPRSAVEVQFANAGGENEITVRNIHVFQNYADTVYEPPSSLTHATHSWGKLNHFEFLVSQSSIEVRVSPYSEDGTTFGEATLVYTQAINLPFTRGYVHLSLHNHATLKYTQPDTNTPWGIIDAPVARVDNFGFDGPVITNWREFEVPDSLVKFNEANFQPYPDPHNPENAGVDIGYVVGDSAQGPKQTLHIKNVDLSRAAGARVGVSLWADLLSQQGDPTTYTLRARLNGKAWRDRKLNAQEAAFAKPGPTVTDPQGKPIGNPATQGRLALLIDIPLDDLVPGDNTLEFVTANIPTNYPPIVCNIDLILGLN